VRTEGQTIRRLTVRAPGEGTSLRVVLERDVEIDSAEIVFQVDGRLNITNLEVCVDSADQFKCGTDFEDAVIHPSVLMLAFLQREISKRAYLGIARPRMGSSKSVISSELT